MLYLRLALLASLCCLQARLGQAANPVVSLMMQQLGVELPPEPPQMPTALKEQMEASQRRVIAQRRLQAARQLRLRAMRLHDAQKNPYSGRPAPPVHHQHSYHHRPHHANHHAHHRHHASYRHHNSYNHHSSSSRHHDLDRLFGHHYSPGSHHHSSHQHSSQHQSPAYRTVGASRQPVGVVYSPAAAPRRPAHPNAVAGDKGNPYSGPAKAATVETKANNPYSSVKSKGNPNPYSNTPSETKSANPYASSRAVGVSDAQHKVLTHKAEQLYRQQRAKAALKKRMEAKKGSKSMVSMVKKIMDQPKKEMEAMGAGCMKMTGGLAAMATMQNCRNPVLQGMCMTMPQTPKCVNVGVGAMCCPFYMSETSVQAVSYFNKIQKYQQQMMRFMENFM